MSRDILFRGKSTRGNHWVEGSLIVAKNFCCILDNGALDDMDYPYLDGELGWIDGRATPVIPETVGQYTGLTDINGKKIFEGDIIQKVYSECRGVCYVVKMSTERGGWYPFACDDGCGCCSCDVAESNNCEVIGNIHDNPELLEGVVQE